MSTKPDLPKGVVQPPVPVKPHAETKEVKPHAHMAAAKPEPVPPTPDKEIKPFYNLGEGSEPEAPQ